MIDDYQLRTLWGFVGLCGVGGVPWLIAHGVSRLSKAHRHAIRFGVMSGFAALWIFFLWPLTGRGHWEELPRVVSILAWWAGIVVGNLIEQRRETSEEPTGGG